MFPPDQIISLLKFEGLLEELEKKNDFELRVQITLQAIENALPLKIKCEQKDSEESIKVKSEADKLFVKQKGRNKVLFDALILYNRSIARAENSSTALAQAYANRSAILFHLNKLEGCIRDIDRALELSYPDHLRANLLRRKAKCFKIQGKIEAEKVCEEARQWLENMSLSDEKKEKLEAKITNVTNVSEYKRADRDNEKSEKVILPNMIPNEKIPSASNAVSIKYNKDLGKHLIANHDINSGELLIIEKVYASILSPANIYTHCSHCFVRTWDSIPCENCINAMYCSEKCRSEAWEQYHDIECPIKGYFFGMRMNDLAPFSFKLAVFAVREAGSIKKLRKKLKEIDDCKDYLMKSISDDGIYHSDKYQPLYSLVTHEDNRKRFDILTISLNAAFTLYYMFTLTSFFGENLDRSVSTLYKNKDAMFFGKLIAHHYMTIQLNDHEFSELYDDEYIRIGSVIGPVTSLLNHSCNPNVGRCPVLKNNTVQQVVYALYPIKEGSQIFDDYGCNFAFTPKSKREEFIKRFYFKCNCIACNEIWPLFEDLPSVLTIITDKQKKVDVARAIVRSKQHQRTIYEVGIHKYRGSKADILESLANSITIVTEGTMKPSKEYAELLELFRQAFVRIHGNSFEL